MSKTLLFQGDSITDCGRLTAGGAGYPSVNLGPGYPGLIASRILGEHPKENWTVLNRGISGNRIVDLYARWKADCINLKPDVVSILIGVNDTWHEFGNRNGVEPARYDEFYRKLIDWTKEALPSVQFVLMEPFVLPFGAVTEAWIPEIEERQRIVRQIAADYKTMFVPLQKMFDQSALEATPDYWLVDGVHPTPAGHWRIAREWFKAARFLQ